MGSSGDLGPWDDRVLVRAYESAVRKYQGAHGLQVDPVPEQPTPAAPPLETRSLEALQEGTPGTSAPANPPPVDEPSAKMAALAVQQQESTTVAGTPFTTDDVYAQYEDPSGWHHYPAPGGAPHSYGGQERSRHPHPPPGGPPHPPEGPPPPPPPHHLSPAAAPYPEGFSHHKHPPPPPAPGGDHSHPRPPPHGPPHPPTGHRPPPPSHWHGHPHPPPCQAGRPRGHHFHHPPPPPPYCCYPYAYPPPPPYCEAYWTGHGGPGPWAAHHCIARQREAPSTVWFPSAEEEVSSVKAEGPASETCPSEAAAAPDGVAAGAPPMPTALPQDREELAALLMVWYKAGYQTASYLQGQTGGH